MASKRHTMSGLHETMSSATKPPMQTPPDGVTPGTIINDRKLVEAWDALAKVLKEFVLVARQREISDDLTLKNNARTRCYVVWGGFITSLIVVAATIIGVTYATTLGQVARKNDRLIQNQLHAVMNAVTAHQAATLVEEASQEADHGKRRLEVKAAEAAFEAQQVLDQKTLSAELDKLSE